MKLVYFAVPAAFDIVATVFTGDNVRLEGDIEDDVETRAFATKMFAELCMGFVGDNAGHEGGVRLHVF